jgi:hypothetical protein
MKRETSAGPSSPWFIMTLLAAIGGTLGISAAGGQSDGGRGATVVPVYPPSPRKVGVGAEVGPSSAAAASQADGVSAILEGFAGLSATTEAASRPGAGARTRRAADRICALGYRSVDVLVATLPDPLDSPFAKFFDDGMTAIQVAMGRSGYVVDRFFDPWHTEADGAPADRENASVPRHRLEPGAILFRRHQNRARDLMAVLLVGETPTWGVQREALGAALTAARAITGARCAGAAQSRVPAPGTAATGAGSDADSPPTLRLLAPATSGTTESLRATLTDWFRAQAEDSGTPGRAGAQGGGSIARRGTPHQAPFNLQIISGSSSADTNRWILSKELQREVRKTFPQFTATFQATVHPDSQMREFVMDYLTERLEVGNIALLTESSTSYGEQFFRFDTAADGHRHLETVIQLPFPLHISKLRNEYARQRIANPGAAGVRPEAPRRQVALANDEAGDTDDAFPTKSRLTQAGSDIALVQILRAIATERVSGVGIIATDPEDVLFLVRKVRDSFPSVTVVVVGADLLYLHDDAPFMRGVLVASTYPLLPWNQRLSFPFEGGTNRLMFPTGNAEGIFNATLLLLGGLTDANVMEYGDPFTLATDGLRPPLWMTAVGKGAFWPLAIADANAKFLPKSNYLQMVGRQLDRLERKRTEVEHTAWAFPRCPGFALALAILGLLNALLIVAYVRGQRSTARTDRTAGRVLDLLLPPRIYAHPRMQRFELAALLGTFLALSVGFAAVAAVTAIPGAAEVTPWQAMVAAFCVETAILLGMTVHAILCWLGCPPGSGRPLRWLAAIASTLIAVAMAARIALPVVSYLKLPSLQRVTPTALMFFVERARNLDSGVSLLATAMLLALTSVLWHLGHLRQVRIVEDATVLRRLGVVPGNPDKARAATPPTPTPTTPTTPTTPAAGEPIRPLLDLLELSTPMRDVVKEVEGIWPSRFGWALMVLVCAVALWISRSLAFFEWRVLGWICAAGYAVLLALLVFGCARFLRTWRALERVLARVAPLPVTEALARIPAELITSFKRPWDACVMEVWQRHCQRVFAGLRNDPELRQTWCARLGVAPDELRSLLAEPVGLQIERAEQKPAAPVYDDAWTKIWEEFLAMRLVAFIQYVRTHLANFGATVTAAMLPVLLATTFYPLRENRFLLMLVLVLAGSAIAFSAIVFMQMSRNYVLSRLENTEAGRVTWDRDLMTKLLLHVAVPLLALVSVKFPELGRGVGSLIGALSKLTAGGG